VVNLPHMFGRHVGDDDVYGGRNDLRSSPDDNEDRREQYESGWKDLVKITCGC
jgi:hypothetical protein